MICLDSCAVLDMLFDESDAKSLAQFLETEQSNGREIIFLPLMQLESSSVIAVRHKEGKFKAKDLDDSLSCLNQFRATGAFDDMTGIMILEAARIKSEHAASMVDCYLIANAIYRKAEILTSDPEILKYRPKRAIIRKVSKKFSAISWRI